jgi:Asp-tRNA(Asn)/Glu-tRNA(Gln) amidotransferase A subunit family amidase
MAPVSLGSDTYGSLRVPASLCGVFSFKPTYGRLPRTGTFPFVDSLDHLGPFARTTRDLALAYDTLQGHDPEDHACAPRPLDPATPHLGFGMKGLRVGLLGGWFSRNAGQAARAAAAAAADAFATETDVVQLELDAAEAGRAAAYLITNSESAAFHLDRLRYRAGEFDPDTRDHARAGGRNHQMHLTRGIGQQRLNQTYAIDHPAGARDADDKAFHAPLPSPLTPTCK